MPSANSEFYFFIFNLDSICFFPWEIAVARASDTILKKGGENGHPCPIHDLTEDDFSFSPLSMILAADLSYLTFIMLIYGLPRWN